jgi:hypothetical protein
MDIIYIPRKKKVLRDTMIALVLISAVVLINVQFSVVNFVVPMVLLLSIGALYVFIMGILPYIKFTGNDELEYRTDYGVTRRIKLSDIKKVTLGSGLGGYEHALFVYHEDDSGEIKKNKK